MMSSMPSMSSNPVLNETLHSNKTHNQSGNYEKADSIDVGHLIKTNNDIESILTKNISNTSQTVTNFSNIENDDNDNDNDDNDNDNDNDDDDDGPVKVSSSLNLSMNNKKDVRLVKLTTHAKCIEKSSNSSKRRPSFNFTDVSSITNKQCRQTYSHPNSNLNHKQNHNQYQKQNSSLNSNLHSHLQNLQNNSSILSNNYKQNMKTTVIEENLDVKNRCVDRYDSFESSDSGVGTSISCTESNNSVSEDTLERITPSNSCNVSNIENNILLHSAISIAPASHEIMSPQMLQESSTPNISINPSKGLNTAPLNLKNQNGKNNVRNKSMQKDGKRDGISNTLNNHYSTLEWPWNTIVSNMTASPSNVVVTKKRLASELSDVREHSYLKKVKKSGAAVVALPVDNGQCTVNSIGICNSNNIPKRLKAAALEESQTKITGYFKSQIKTHIPQTNDSLKQTSGAAKDDNCLTRVNNLTSMESNSLTMHAPATTASLNKYFNIFDHLKETSNENGKIKNKRVYEFENDVFTSSSKKTSTPKSNMASTQLPRNISILPMAIPALKKIERAKPTKIAQVAPNLRKTPSSNSSNSNQNGSGGKSPLKKHVAIAPRTPEMKQQQAVAIKPSAARSLPQNTAQQQMAVHLQSAAQQPTVLLTTFQIPSTQQVTAKDAMQSSNLTSPSTQSRLNNGDPTILSSNPSNTTTVYQLPVQLPNLIQIPQILTTENANIQFNNLGTDASVAKLATTATTTSEAQAAQTAASQYSCFLNGTIFKLQQFTTATTTTASSSSAVGASISTNPFNLLNSCDLQDFVMKQQQEQYQKAAVTNTTSFQEIFQQQIAAAIAANHQQGQQLQRISNPTNMQHPVVMATPTGLLLNTASLPTMLAQAAAVIAINNQQQKAIAVPALQPIQQNQLPALSPIFTPQSQDTEHMAQYAHHTHQQFITTSSMQPPPLSSVTLSNISQLQPLLQKQSQATTTKLTIIKAKSTSSPSSFPALSSQPPPLVTISNSKVRPKNSIPLKSVSPTPAAALPSQTIIQMPLSINKACSNRTSKGLNADSIPTNLMENKLTHGKVGVTNGKIIATSTTPPPLIPRLPTSFKPTPITTKDFSLTNTNKTTKENKLPPTSNYILTNGFITNENSKTYNINTNCKGASFNIKSESNEHINHIKSVNSRHLQLDKEKAKRANENFDLIKNSKESCNEIIHGPTLYQPVLSFSSTLSSKPKREASEEKIIDKMCTVNKNDLHLSMKETKFCNLQSAEVKEELKPQLESYINEKVHPENSSSSFNSISNSMCSATDTLIENATSNSRSSMETPSSINSQMDSSNSAGLPTINNDTSTASSNVEISAKEETNIGIELSCNFSNSTESSCINTSIESNTKDTETGSDSQDYKKDDEIPQSMVKCHSHGCISKSDGLSEVKFAKFDSSICCYSKVIDTTSSECRHLNSIVPLSKSSPDLLESLRVPSAKSISIQTSATMVDTKFAEIPLKKSAISPILSQPKIIRFPAESGLRLGTKSGKRHDGVCYWDKCNKKHESNSKLLDHMQTQHVNMQTGPFCCLWVGCKVYNRESCSRRWLERHVLSHGGSKQFKCIVDGCGLRFGSQLALQKHVNNHFSTTETKDNTNKRTSDPPVPKQLRKNGKKLRYRRQPFSARMFDFFDAGIMEALQHRLRQMSTLTNSCNDITFHGNCIMKRKTFQGTFECFIRWSPGEIIADEWLPESNEPYIKTMKINQMDVVEKNQMDKLLSSANSVPYAPTLFKNSSNINTEQNGDAQLDDKEGNSIFMEDASTIETCSNEMALTENSLGEVVYNTCPQNTSASGTLPVNSSNMIKSERNIKNTRKTQRRFLTSR